MRFRSLLLPLPVPYLLLLCRVIYPISIRLRKSNAKPKHQFKSSDQNPRDLGSLVLHIFSQASYLCVPSCCSTAR
ncbi:hypothetical protein C8R43DRAFT_977111 [Mycena crocata]|nr:hypothetical protein C8R43DRAFT_977111 [Mycena crocata]